jgi:excisionase family DNA binding protein
MTEGTTKQTKEYLTVEQVADVLLVHWQTVLDYIRTGQLPAVKLNKGYRIARAELDNFLRQKTTGKSNFDVVKVKERVSNILAITELKDQRTITLSASLLPEPLIDDLFSDDGEESYAGLLRNPPTTRSMGWGFKTSQNDPKPVLGQCLELKIGRGAAVRIFKDGNVIATGSAGSNYLGWAVNKDATGNMVEGDNINALAAAEFMYNFSWLLSKIVLRTLISGIRPEAR